MAIQQTDRNALLDKVLVDDNLEFDFLSGKQYIFDKTTIGNSDKTVMVSEKFLHRLDYLAAITYGDSKLWWFIAMRNDILNPMTDMKIGDVLIIPNIYEYYAFFGENSETEVKNLQIFQKRNFVV